LLAPRPLAIILLTGLIIGLLAGAYPALILSNTRLISILRSGFRITGGNAGLRRTLVIVQFTISLFLIITTMVILQQMNYIRNKDLGFDRDHVLVLPIDYQIHNRYDALKTAIRQLPGTVDVSGSYDLPVSVGWGDGLNVNNGREEVQPFRHAIPADLHFISTMNMHLLAGSDFTAADFPSNFGSDSNKADVRFILNESAVRKIGWTPQEAIGKTVTKDKPGHRQRGRPGFQFLLYAPTDRPAHDLPRYGLCPVYAGPYQWRTTARRDRSAADHLEKICA
jgi:putative ABC transport system permease protein